MMIFWEMDIHFPINKKEVILSIFETILHVILHLSEYKIIVLISENIIISFCSMILELCSIPGTNLVPRFLILLVP